MPQRTIVFDVNETLLDMSALDPLFADAFGDKGVRRTWFAQTLHNSLCATIFGTYENFQEMAKAALEMTALKRGRMIDDERMRRILRGFGSLPPHGDVVAGLERLRSAGFRLAVLTNSGEELVETQLRNAHIRDYFDAVLTVDAVRRFKPAREVYEMAAEELDTLPSELLLVAAHDWDCAGAMHAGLKAAFVNRHGTALNPLDPRPQIVAPDIGAVVDAILAQTAAV